MREFTTSAPAPPVVADADTAGAGRAGGGTRACASDTFTDCAGRDGEITTRRSFDAYAARGTRTRCGPRARSRTVAGVLPYSRPSTDTNAPAGTERIRRRPSAATDGAAAAAAEVEVVGEGAGRTAAVASFAGVGVGVGCSVLGASVMALSVNSRPAGAVPVVADVPGGVRS